MCARLGMRQHSRRGESAPTTKQKNGRQFRSSERNLRPWIRELTGADTPDQKSDPSPHRRSPSWKRAISIWSGLKRSIALNSLGARLLRVDPDDRYWVSLSGGDWATTESFFQ